MLWQLTQHTLWHLCLHSSVCWWHICMSCHEILQWLLCILLVHHPMLVGHGYWIGLVDTSWHCQVTVAAECGCVPWSKVVIAGWFFIGDIFNDNRIVSPPTSTWRARQKHACGAPWKLREIRHQSDRGRCPFVSNTAPLEQVGDTASSLLM